MLPLVRVFCCDGWSWCNPCVTMRGASLAVKQNTEAKARAPKKAEPESQCPSLAVSLTYVTMSFLPGQARWVQSFRLKGSQLVRPVPKRDAHTYEHKYVHT